MILIIIIILIVFIILYFVYKNLLVKNIIIQPTTQSTIQPIIQPVVQSIIKPVVQSIIKPVVQSIIKPVVQPIIKPVVQPNIFNNNTKSSIPLYPLNTKNMYNTTSSTSIISRRDMIYNISKDDFIISNINNLVNILINDIIINNNVFVIKKTPAISTLSKAMCSSEIDIRVNNQYNISIDSKNEMKNKTLTTIKENILVAIKNFISKEEYSRNYIRVIIYKNAEVLKITEIEVKRIEDIIVTIISNLSFGWFKTGEQITINLETDVVKPLGISSYISSALINNSINNNVFNIKVNNFINMFNDISTENIITLSKMTCTDLINLTTLEQFNNIKATFINSFNNQVVTSISNTITTSISKTYSSLYDAIDATKQPEALRLAQYDIVEAMYLLTYYNLCRTDTPDTLKLKNTIEARLTKLGESTVNTSQPTIYVPPPTVYVPPPTV